jgi:hypothetical protein
VAFGKLIRDGRLIAPIEVFHQQRKRSDEAAYVVPNENFRAGM